MPEAECTRLFAKLNMLWLKLQNFSIRHYVLFYYLKPYHFTLWLSWEWICSSNDCAGSTWWEHKLCAFLAFCKKKNSREHEMLTDILGRKVEQLQRHPNISIAPNTSLIGFCLHWWSKVNVLKYPNISVRTQSKAKFQIQHLLYLAYWTIPQHGDNSEHDISPDPLHCSANGHCIWYVYDMIEHNKLVLFLTLYNSWCWS